MFNIIDIKTDNGIADIPELQQYISLNETQLLHFYEPDIGLFIVESPMVIERALAAGYEPVSFVMIDTLAEEMCRKVGELIKDRPWSQKEIPVYVADYETIAGFTGVNITRGILSVMKRTELSEISDIISGKKRIAVFDDVENPTNVGAMFRSAAALGIEAVIIAGTSSDPLYRRASRVSMGTVFQIPWTKTDKNRVRGTADYIDVLHESGFKTVAMALSDNSVNIDDEDIKQEEKLAIILGNEGFGLSEEVIKASDYVVKIPMREGVDSLNVAAASSIAFWEITKK